MSYIPPQDSIAQPSVICSASSVGDTSQQPQDYTSSSTGLLQFRPPSDPIQTSRPSMPDVPYPFYRPPRSNLLHEQPQFSQARLDNGLDALQSYPDQSVPIYLPPGNVAEQHAHLQPDELRQRLQMAPRLGMDGIKRSPGRPRKNPDAPLDLIKPKGKRGRKPGQSESLQQNKLITPKCTFTISHNTLIRTEINISLLNVVFWDVGHKVDSRFAPSQWETALLCNDVPLWLGASLDSALGPVGLVTFVYFVHKFIMSNNNY